jgi:outer membrane lipoprotein-sorting protein
MRKSLLACLVSICLVSTLHAEPQKQAIIQKIEKYFDDLKTFQADLSQRNPDGSSAKGKFFLQRPDQFRIQYSAPKEMILVSDGNVFIEYDPKEDMPNFISLESTPASLLLKPKLRLSGEVSVRNIRVENGIIYVELYKTADPDVGHMTLIFQEKPMHLMRWVVQDSQGNITEVALGNIVENKPLKGGLFDTARVKR